MTKIRWKAKKYLNLALIIIINLGLIFGLWSLGGRGVLGFFTGLTSGIIIMACFVLSKNDYMAGILFYMADLMGDKKNEGIGKDKGGKTRK